MKLEKLNENQIRCTLSREDLESRNIRLSELAYGSPKAQALFKEIMSFASYKLSFEAEDIPLMIEAVPLSRDSLVLLVTKVDYPEELDTRFSKFSSFDDPDYAPVSDSEAVTDEPVVVPELDVRPDGDAVLRAYTFDSIDTLISVSRLMASRPLASSLYSDARSGSYLLIVGQGLSDKDAFKRSCSLLSEYGMETAMTGNSLAHLNEHYDLLVQTDVFGKLKDL